MKKQILRVKQLADQTLLRADKSEVLTEDLIHAEKRVDAIKQVWSSTGKKISMCLHGVGMEDSSSEKIMKKIPEMVLWNCLQECQKNLSYSNLLKSVFGECAMLQNDLGRELINYEKDTEQQILSPIHSLLENDLPNIGKLRKNLSKLTLDMDAAKNRYQQAQKHSVQGNSTSANVAKTDSLREEAEDTSMKVDQCRDSLAAEMFSLISREAEFAHILVQWYQLQADHHRKVLATLDNALPSLWQYIENSPEKPVFGVPLEEHLRVTDRKVALVIEACVCCILKYGMDEEGLFRIAGSTSKMKRLKNAFNAGMLDTDITDFEKDPHTVASVLKLYLRELPEPLLTFSRYDEWKQATSISDSTARLQALWHVVNSLPEPNQNNLRYIVKFLAKLATNSEKNKMNSQNIAIVMAPNLIWAKEDSQPQNMSMNMSIANAHSAIVDTLVNYADWFFPGDEEFLVTASATPRIVGDAVSANTHFGFDSSSSNGDIDEGGNLLTAGLNTSPTSQSPKVFHRPGKKPAPPAPQLPKEKKTPAEKMNPVRQISTLDRPPKGEKPVPMARSISIQKPEIAEKPSIVKRRSQESLNNVVAEVSAAETVECRRNYSTQSLERPNKFDRPPPAPRLSKMNLAERQSERPVTVHAATLERPSVPPPERPKIEKRHSFTDASLPKTLEPLKEQEVQSLKPCDFGKNAQEEVNMSFVDDSDPDEINQAAFKDLPAKSENETSNSSSCPSSQQDGEHKPDKWNFLVASQEKEKPPERPPRTILSEDITENHDPHSQTPQIIPPQQEEIQDNKVPERPPRSVSPNINTTGPPPDLIASSEKQFCTVIQVSGNVSESKTLPSSGVPKSKPARPQPPPPPPPAKPRVGSSSEETRL